MFADILRFKKIEKKNATGRHRLTSSNRAAIFVSTSREERDKRWTNLFGYKLGESTENKKGPLFFWGKETIQTFNSSVKAFTLLFAKW